MTSRSFYKNLSATPPSGLVDRASYRAAPDDWYILVADIVGSTKAIAAGKYKDVNMVSASAITAVINAADKSEIAYIFGGDGATLLVPPDVLLEVAQALHGTRVMARDAFQLEMRVGAVKLADLAAKGAPVRVAKTETAPAIYQAALAGEGVTLAEKLIKDKEHGSRYDITQLFSSEQLTAKEANFNGLECRWQPLHSRHGADVSLIIAARGTDEAANAALYAEVLAKVGDICGHADDWKPAHADNLNVSATAGGIAGETRVRTHGMGSFARLKYIVNVRLLCWTGILCLATGKKAGNFDGAKYRDDTARHTDFIKFDNALRLVMDVTREQQKNLTAYLEDLRSAGKIFYGLHAAPAALMTCLVFDYGHDHFHFVDGADGGYALAALQLKSQIREASDLPI